MILAGFVGVYLASGGSVTNLASGSIAGTYGVVTSSGGTVTNAGTITGRGGTAVKFTGTTGGRLAVDPGAVFSGKVSASTSASDTLELAAGGSAGTLAGIGTSFLSFKGLAVDVGATWTLTGANTISRLSVTDDATLTNEANITGGVLLDRGGGVTNAAAVTISNGGNQAVYGKLGDGADTVVNSGTIVDTGTTGQGIDLEGGGSVTNAASASITAALQGVAVYGTSGTVVNSGSIVATGTAGVGVDLETAGSVTNAASASIAGTSIGVFDGDQDAVVNSGSIAATGTVGTGIRLFDGGTVTNAASAVVTGVADGVRGGGTVVNSGSIAGTGTAGIGIKLDFGAVTNATSGSIKGERQVRRLDLRRIGEQRRLRLDLWRLRRRPRLQRCRDGGQFRQHRGRR